jgi:hypothetical protein
MGELVLLPNVLSYAKDNVQKIRKGTRIHKQSTLVVALGDIERRNICQGLTQTDNRNERGCQPFPQS